MQMLLIFASCEAAWLQSCPGTGIVSQWLGAAPAPTGPWPEVPGRTAREKAKLDHFPQSEPFFYGHQSLSHVAVFKGFDFYLVLRGGQRGRGHRVEGRCQIKRVEGGGRSVVTQPILAHWGHDKEAGRNSSSLLPLAA